MDIILIEPEPDDELMFGTSVPEYSSRLQIAKHGFESVTQKLARDYKHYKQVAARHGIEISARRVRKVIDTVEDEAPEEPRPGAASSSRPPAPCCGSPTRREKEGKGRRALGRLGGLARRVARFGLDKDRPRPWGRPPRRDRSRPCPSPLALAGAQRHQGTDELSRRKVATKA